MLYPKCPRCGSGKVKSAENDGVSYGNIHFKRFASGAMTGHPHPLLALVATAISIGDFAYRRLPGCGRKSCLACGHHFN